MCNMSIKFTRHREMLGKMSDVQQIWAPHQPLLGESRKCLEPINAARPLLHCCCCRSLFNCGQLERFLQSIRSTCNVIFMEHSPLQSLNTFLNDFTNNNSRHMFFYGYAAAALSHKSTAKYETIITRYTLFSTSHNILDITIL